MDRGLGVSIGLLLGYYCASIGYLFSGYLLFILGLFVICYCEVLTMARV